VLITVRQLAPAHHLAVVIDAESRRALTPECGQDANWAMRGSDDGFAFTTGRSPVQYHLATMVDPKGNAEVALGHKVAHSSRGRRKEGVRLAIRGNAVAHHLATIVHVLAES
jgi:hypothetical protein